MRQTIKTQRRRLTTLDEERTRLLRVFLDGVIEKDLLAREQQRLAQDMAAAEGVLHAAESTLGDEERVFGLATSLLVEPAAGLLTHQNAELQRQVGLALIERIVLASPSTVSVAVRSELRLLHAAVTASATPRYERRAGPTLDLASLQPRSAPEGPGSADRVLVGVGSPLEERVPLDDVWSG